MKIRYKLKEARVESPEYGQHKSGDPEGAKGSRWENVGLEEKLLQKALDWLSGKTGIKKSPEQVGFSGITDYLGKLRYASEDNVKKTIMQSVVNYAEQNFKNVPDKKKQYIDSLKKKLELIMDSEDGKINPNDLKAFPADAQKLITNYFSRKSLTAQQQGQPGQQQAQQTQTQKLDQRSNIVLPHANLIRNTLINAVEKNISAIIQTLPKEQKTQIITQVREYINSLPEMSNKVIAEAVAPHTRTVASAADQKALKTKLQAKHPNIALINNLPNLEKELMNQIKGNFTVSNIKDKLLQSVPKEQQGSKEAIQYNKSLQKQPQKHLDVFLKNITFVIKKIISIVKSGIEKTSPAQQKESLDESLQKQLQKLAGIKNED